MDLWRWGLEGGGVASGLVWSRSKEECELDFASGKDDGTTRLEMEASGCLYSYSMEMVCVGVQSGRR